MTEESRIARAVWSKGKRADTVFGMIVEWLQKGACLDANVDYGTGVDYFVPS